MRLILPTLVGIAVTRGPVRAASFSSGAKGTTSAQFLKLAPGARAIAMGEAYTAVADDPLALYWNPAGLNVLKHSQSLSFMHAIYVESINYGSLAYAYKLPGDLGAIGASYSYLNIGSIDRTDDAGVAQGSYSPQDNAFSVGWGRKLFSVPVGAAIKYISSKIVSSASTYALDLGARVPWKLLNNRLSLAVSARNIGPGLKFHSERDPLPFELRAGSALAYSDNLLFSADLALPVDNSPYAAFGAEYQKALPSFLLHLRGGVNSRTFGDIAGLSGISLGFGIDYQSLGIDYALAPLGKLGLTHRISLGYSFR